jgi:hypothetical protein
MKQVLTFAISGKKGAGKDTFGGFLLEHAQRRGWNVVRKNLADPLKEEAAKGIAIFESHRVNPEKYRGFGYFTADNERMKADLDVNSNEWESVLNWAMNVYDLSMEEAVMCMLSMTSAALSGFDDPGGDGSNLYDPEIYENVLAEFHHPTHKLSWRVLLQWWGTEFRRRLCGNDYWRQQLIQFNHSLPDKTIHGAFDIRFPDEFDMARNDLTNGFLIRVERPSVQMDGDQHPSETGLDHKKPHDWNALITNEGSLEDLEKGAETILLNALLWARLE